MSSTNTLTPSNLLGYHSTERLEKLLDDLIEPHPDIIWNIFEQVLLAETRQETHSTEDYEDEWTEISTQQSRRKWLGIWYQ